MFIKHCIFSTFKSSVKKISRQITWVEFEPTTTALLMSKLASMAVYRNISGALVMIFLIMETIRLKIICLICWLPILNFVHRWKSHEGEGKHSPLFGPRDGSVVSCLAFHFCGPWFASHHKAEAWMWIGFSSPYLVVWVSPHWGFPPTSKTEHFFLFPTLPVVVLFDV